MRGSGVGFGSLSMLLPAFCVAAAPSSADTHVKRAAEKPADLIVSYFRTEETKARRRLAGEIEEAYGGSLDRHLLSNCDQRLP